jgi:hypothetical protein
MAQVLTEGEMMVWAAAYVAALAGGANTREAINKARRAVQFLREIPKKGEDPDTRMMRDFLTDPED